ncbi:MAG: 50S ribosomal protein L18e [Candidatus Hodarchaeales archaeon]|jgi:large subunit ribosomal protein L18e
MMKVTGPSDPNITAMIQWLEKQSRLQDVSIWKRTARELSKPKRLKKRTVINLDSLDRLSSEGAITLLVLGKVLGDGQLSGKALNVAAFSFSTRAREKILATGGSCLTLPELIEKNPKGSNVKLVK